VKRVFSEESPLQRSGQPAGFIYVEATVKSDDKPCFESLDVVAIDARVVMLSNERRMVGMDKG